MILSACISIQLDTSSSQSHVRYRNPHELDDPPFSSSHPRPLSSVSGADGVLSIAEKPFHRSGRELVLGHTLYTYGCGFEGSTALE
jgi:hypothetical protein